MSSAPTSTLKAVLSHVCLLCAALSPSPDSRATSLGDGLLCVKKMPWVTKMMNGGHSVLDSVKWSVLSWCFKSSFLIRGYHQLHLSLGSIWIHTSRLWSHSFFTHSLPFRDPSSRGLCGSYDVIFSRRVSSILSWTVGNQSYYRYTQGRWFHYLPK